MNKYILSQNKPNYVLNHAGSKATLDVERYLGDKGYKVIQVSDLSQDNRYKRILNVFLMKFKNLKKIESKSIVVMHYPMTFGTINNIIGNLYINKKNINIALIHDLESIRVYKNTELYKQKVEEEIKNLNKFNYVISHNEVMSEWLMEHGLKSKIVNLEIFDYYTEYYNKNLIFDNEKQSIAFAGNLSTGKSKFVYELGNIESNNIDFNLYGVNYEEKLNRYNRIKYKGVYKAEELPAVLNEQFGLIWDGKSIDTCTGNMGEYTQYNNPHKLSMYVASGIPVIAWKKSAISRFINKHSIGITVNSLNDIEKKISLITDKEYKDMLYNLDILRQKVINGYFIKTAIEKIEHDIGLE